MKSRFLKIALLTAATIFVGYQILLLDIPDISLLKTHNPKFSSYMTEDEKLDDKDDISIVYTPISKVSPNIVRAVLAAEDDTYFKHRGFNWNELYHSILTNIKKRKLARGASTITQQLARNLFLSKDKSLIRKLREWLVTYKLESELSKERILELYLNFAEFGPGVYGIQAASQYHFSTKPKNLSRHQSALMAAVLPNPKYYGQKPYPAKTYRKQKRILGRMAKFDLHLPKDLFVKANGAKPVTNKIKLIPVDKNDDDDFKEFDDVEPSEVFLDEK